jgi:hypothetical protein
VTADEETVLARAESRAVETSRRVPKELLLETMEQIPTSLRILSPYVDYIATFQNENDTFEPVLLWASSKQSLANASSCADVACLQLLDENVLEEMSQHRITYNIIKKRGEEALAPRRTSLSFSADEYVVIRATKKDTSRSPEGEDSCFNRDGKAQPSDEWKVSFRSTWKMTCSPR